MYFAGDTMLILELGEIPERLGHISLALLPTNGVHIKPAGNMQVVMNAQEAAELTAMLKPELAVAGERALEGILGQDVQMPRSAFPGRIRKTSPTRR